MLQLLKDCHFSASLEISLRRAKSVLPAVVNRTSRVDGVEDLLKKGHLTNVEPEGLTFKLVAKGLRDQADESLVNALEGGLFQVRASADIIFEFTGGRVVQRCAKSVTRAKTTLEHMLSRAKMRSSTCSVVLDALEHMLTRARCARAAL